MQKWKQIISVGITQGHLQEPNWMCVNALVESRYILGCIWVYQQIFMDQ